MFSFSNDFRSGFIGTVVYPVKYLNIDKYNYRSRFHDSNYYLIKSSTKQWQSFYLQCTITGPSNLVGVLLTFWRNSIKLVTSSGVLLSGQAVKCMWNIFLFTEPWNKKVFFGLTSCEIIYGVYTVRQIVIHWSPVRSSDES